jgi:DNA polymerase III delta prime subunit
MDTNKEFNFLTYTPHTLPPAQLWIGKHDNALHEVEQFLQKTLCKNNGCNTCITCMQIREKQHHAIMWLQPEKNYTIDQLEDLFTTLTFQQEPDELFFFIIQKADFLTPACANKLLKPIEEPPRGYHFILLAERSEHILPTIRSRCIEYSLKPSINLTNSHPLYECFTKKMVSCDEFSKIIDTAHINERESLELLNAILYYWLSNERKQPIITILQNAHLQPPMPGSSTIFWRNLYLQLYKDLSSLPS